MPRPSASAQLQLPQLRLLALKRVMASLTALRLDAQRLKRDAEQCAGQLSEARAVRARSGALGAQVGELRENVRMAEEELVLEAERVEELERTVHQLMREEAARLAARRGPLLSESRVGHRKQSSHTASDAGPARRSPYYPGGISRQHSNALVPFHF